MTGYPKMICVNLLILFSTYHTGNGQQSCVPSSGDTVTVAQIDEVKISKKEFVWRMNGFRSACFDFFLKNYNVSYVEKGFWDRSFDSMTPLQWIKEKTLQQLKIEKGRIKIMQQYGLLQGYSYELFLAAFAEENEKRKSLVEKGKIIYGLQQFDEYSFYDYILSNSLLEAQRRMLAKHPVSEKAMQDHYELVKKEKFGIPPTIFITYVIMDKSKYASRDYSKLYALVKTKDHHLISIAIQEKRYQKFITRRDIIFEPSARKADELKWGNMFHQAILLKDGSISDIFKDNNGNDCFLICRKKVNNGYLSFNEVRENVKMHIASNRLEQMLASNIESLQVKIYTSVWDGLQIR